MRHLCRSMLVVVVVLCAGVAFLAAPALAAAAPALLSSFGSFGETRGQSIAVDQSTGGVSSGDVYVYNHAGIFKFNSLGEPVAFSNGGGHEIRGVEGASEPAEFEVAVDSSAGPTKGDIYFATGEDHEGFGVNIYSSEGEKLGELTEAAGAPWGEPCGVAVDAAGDVYVGLWAAGLGAHVNEYTPAGGIVSDADYSGSLSGLDEVCNVAVDSEGGVYAVTYTGGPVMKYAASQFNKKEEPAVGTLVDEHGFTLAVDPVNNDVYVDEGSQVSVYEASGATPVFLESIGAFSGSFGVGVSGLSGDVYVGGGSTGEIDIFGAPVPGAPSVDSEWATDVTGSSVQLHGEVNPHTLSSSYYIEYGVTSAYGQRTPVSGADPVLEAGFTDRAVVQHVQGLAPGSTYHYRLVAHSSFGGGSTTYGSDHTFTTQGLGGLLVLPDDRGWEMVTPIEKSGNKVVNIGEDSGGGVVQAAADGNSITYASLGVFGDSQAAPSAVQYLATRGGPGDWSAQSIATPMNSGSYELAGKGGPYKAFSTDLQSAIELSGGITNPPLAPGAPAGYQNYYLRDDDSGALQALLRSTPEVSAGAFFLRFEGSSSDLSHIVVNSGAGLTSGAVSKGEAEGNLYEWSAGQFYAVNVLPGATDGMTTPGAFLGASGSDGDYADRVHAVSDDGSRVFFTELGNLYVREDADTASARTVLVAGGGAFWGASSNGETAFFTDGGDLFAFDVATGVAHDLTLDSDPGGAGVQGVLGASDDGAYVYFVANGRLAPGVSAGNCGGQGEEGSCGLYVAHGGHIALVGMLSQGDQDDWAGYTGARASRVSGDGRHVVFMSSASLTGYDNHDAASGNPDSEVYEYSAPTAAEEERGEVGRLVCVSCNPSGGRPVGSSRSPGGTPYEQLATQYQSRVVSEDGSRVFFDSNDALVPQDTDGVQDVYEYEAGHVYLISGGTGIYDSQFVDASASGDDVFFITGTSLVPQDSGSVDLYDARVGGGAPALLAPAACSGTGCQGVPGVPPIFATPSSETFDGVGNFTAPVKTPAKPRKKHPKKAKPKKHKKRSGKHAAKRHARKSTTKGKRR
jgi:hypothetical protein